MIHQLLTLTRPIFCLDTETTGVDIQSSRIVEIGFQQWTAEGMIKEWRSLVNPGVPIPPEATAVHRITDEMVNACQRCGKGSGDTDAHVGLGDDAHAFQPAYTFKQLAANLAKGFRDCDFCGQNVRFDLRILDAEMRRAGAAWDYVGARIIDSGQLERLAVPRSLSHLYAKYVKTTCTTCQGFGKLRSDDESQSCQTCSGTGSISVPHDGAHGALSDVRAASTVIAKQLETHASLPRDVDALHALSWPGWIDASGCFKFVGDTPTMAFGKWRDKPMRSVEREYFEWLGGPKSNNFSEEVKKIARNAARGIFPQMKQNVDRRVAEGRDA